VFKLETPCSSQHGSRYVRRCAFSSSSIARTAAFNLVREIPHGIFTLFFPADCRVCKRALVKWTRVPVCGECLASPPPLVADYFCAVCNTPFLNAFPLDEKGVCTACRLGLRGFDHAASFGTYEGTLRSLIHLLKYSGMKPLARPLAVFLDRVVPSGEHFDAVVPVPLYWRRQWERGFNQAELLARCLGRHRGIPVWNALRRKRSTATQAGLASAGRRRNVAGAFVVRGNARLAGKKILLIDDVMTTGATASACAAALKRGGAGSISLLTLARVDRRLRP
jgi:ComF family protein